MSRYWRSLAHWLALALVGGFSTLAWPMPPYQDALFARYPGARTALAGCVGCHDSPAANALNAFGSAFLANGFAFDAVLEALDSDGDGVSNGAELTASPVTAPGDPNSNPGSGGATPPPAPTPTPPPTIDGPTLYGNYCAACHGALATSSKGGATLSRLQSAVTGNAGGMGALSALTTTQLQAIVDALAPAVTPPAPAPIPTPAPTPIPTPAPTPPTADSAYSGTWWNPAESGWWLDINRQGNALLVTVFTYDESGTPMWLMAAGQLQADGRTISADLYRPTGGALGAQPDGVITVSFASAGAATVSYTYHGSVLTKDLVPQVYPIAPTTCGVAGRGTGRSYQDPWRDPADAAWGVHIVQQGAALTATLATYDAAGNSLWLVMLMGVQQTDQSYLGELLQVSGSAFGAASSPVAGNGVTVVGTMRFAFADERNGTLTYTINGAAVTRTIVRQAPARSVGPCAGKEAPAPGAVIDGPKLYADNCSACHQPLTSTTKGGATLARIQAAIAANIGSMANLVRLTVQQLQAIVATLAAVGPSNAAPTLDGATLYGGNCAGCHSALPSTTKGGATLARLQAAIAGNVGGMGYLASLSPAQLQAIVKVLAAAAPPAPPATIDGATLYGSKCASCHRSLASSTKAGITLARLQKAISGNVGGMGSLANLSAAQLRAIVNVLATITPPVVVDGPTLYATYCASCHRPLATSTKGQATLTRLQTAIAAGTGGMGSLSSLSAGQLQAIVTALASVPGALPPACGSCHALPPRSGQHSEHRSRSCSTCHGAGYSTSTVDAAKHNNGVKDLVSTIGWNAARRSCSNSCHGTERW